MGEKIMIRDERTGQASLMPRAMLDHPHWAEFFTEVRTDKPVNEDLRRTTAKASTKKRLTEPAPEFDSPEPESKDES